MADAQERLAEHQARISRTQELLSLNLDRLARNQEGILEVLREVRDARRGERRNWVFRLHGVEEE